MECSAEDPGFPAASRADWTHNGAPLPEVTSLTLRVAEAGAASAGNYSCSPRNEAGSSKAAAASRAGAGFNKAIKTAQY